MSNKQKLKKNCIQKFTILFVIFAIIGIILWGSVYAVNFMIGEEENTDNTENSSPTNVIQKKKIINALICGKNQDLTDTIIYVKYN